MTDKQEKEQQLTDNVEKQTPEEVVEEPYQLNVKLPDGKSIKIIASPREAIQDIKQSIMESPETCANSCFYLAFEGKRINDYLELGEIEGLTSESELDLIEDTYTERDVRLHINRLRDLLAGPYKPDPSSIGIDPAISFLTAITGEIDEEIINDADKKMDDLFSDEPVPKHVFTDLNIEERSQLSKIVPSDFKRVAPECIKSLALSGWNPVPHQQKLKGDLLYLTITTLEGEVVHITASTKGFFVNNSTHFNFDPSPRQTKRAFAHSLITLLQKISPLFATRFVELQDFITHHHMLEVLPVNTYCPNYPWAVEAPQHLYDASRPCETYLIAGSDAVESLRDWNDEIQSHRELPKTVLQERVLRERLITKVQAEFTEAAIRGAMAVVDGSVIPLNPLEPEESHMYVYNNIFFSKGNDSRSTFETLGGDEAAHVAVSKDLEGVKILNSIDADGLYTLANAIVDYKGIRIVAQSIVPGIFRRQDENSIIYGSIDNGDQISADPIFHECIGKDIAKSLHLSEHTVIDGKGDESQLYTSQETKGLLGADGRRYMLDLYRLCPVDIIFQENECIEKDSKPAYPHKMTLLRPELMSLFWEHKFRQWVKAKTDEIKNEKEAAKSSITSADSQKKMKILQPENEQTKKEEEIIREASQFLINEIVPSLVLDFASYAVTPLDGDALTKTMHRRGINMRYLGKLAELVSVNKDKRIDYIHKLIIQEMIVRVSKRLLRKYLSKCSPEETSLCISHFLNCLLGSSFNLKPSPVLPEGTNRNDFEWAQITPVGLKKLVIQQVLLRFRYKLEETAFEQLRFLPTLRELCIRVGIQISARDYRTEPYSEEERTAFAAEDAAFNRKKQEQINSRNKKSKKHQRQLQEINQRPKRRTTTFIPEDIYNLMPTVKQASSRSVFAEETFEAGKMSIAQGHQQLGLELLLESLALHEQTYGFLHPETSKCYATLAMLYHHNEDRESALDLQRKAVISAERTCGIDHPETIHHYLNLGLFEHAAGRTKLALRYVHHALYYWDLLVGPGHPDSATADNNTGVMLQSLRDYPNSTKFFERACNTHENILGKDHVLTATGYHVLAKAYTLEGNFPKALAAERIAYDIFEKKLGPEDPRTKDSDVWLKELTTNAVIMAQRAREEQQVNTNKTISTTTPEVIRKQVKIPEKPKGELPIDQLLKYINGENKENSQKGKKKSQKKYK
ncbi:clustered mitochondria-domain-containing protein [Cokeromyces recurvatus]|uniref:clustered mitochondria-domain-containing protein n=1 Tax=Cokeromyces recurvatus TaxID=90255 RepID=UPI002220B643|nr:clustered mitochondria-domain-containing protein [Cokeromyces recurvatus]KAI7900383.1 clustered mitochondria-domain-containing protein [Cokeromyces recurvatus]